MTDEVQATFDIGRALDDGEWRGYQMMVLALASLAFVVDGIANQVMAITIPALIHDWHLGRAAFAPVTAVSLIGVTIGTLTGGVLGDLMGRKTVLIGSVLVFGVTNACISGVNTVGMLSLLRLVAGLGIGGVIPAAASLIAEFTPTRRRSRAVNIGLISIPIGIFACGLIGALALQAIGWRNLFILTGGISVALGILLSFVLPESPRYLVKRPSRREELVKLLARMDVAIPAGSRLGDSVQASGKRSLAELFGPDVWTATLSLWGAFFFCFLAVYISLNWIPTLLSSHGYPFWVTSSSLSAWSVGGIIGALLGARLIELFGSRIGLTVLAGAGAVGAFLLSFLPLNPAAPVWPVMVSLAAEGLCLSGLTGCLYGLAAYVYPPNVRATGVGAAGAIGRSGAIVSSFAAVFAMELGRSSFFLAVALTMMICLAFILANRHSIPKDTIIQRAAAHTR